jgi:hypothetical protein
MAASRWRISRAALYGFAAGLIFKAAGLFPATPEPPGIVVHWAYVVGEWAGYAVVVALMFSVTAVIRNLIFVRALGRDERRGNKELLTIHIDAPSICTS